MKPAFSLALAAALAVAPAAAAAASSVATQNKVEPPLLGDPTALPVAPSAGDSNLQAVSFSVSDPGSPGWQLLGSGAVSKVEPPLLGDPTVLPAAPAAGDINLKAVSFNVSDSGVPGWRLLGSGAVSKNTGSGGRGRASVGTDTYAVQIQVDGLLTSAASATTTAQVFTEPQIIQGVNLAAGTIQVFRADGEIQTKVNTTGSEVVAQSGSTLVLWARNRVALMPGLRAASGSIFWAAVDADMDGYSDVEEATDSDGDGMCDAWEFDHGLDPFSAADATLNPDNDSRNNLAEYLAGTDPFNAADGASLPSGYQLVLRLPSNGYVGLRASDWSLTTVANP